MVHWFSLLGQRAIQCFADCIAIIFFIFLIRLICRSEITFPSKPTDKYRFFLLENRFRLKLLSNRPTDVSSVNFNRSGRFFDIFCSPLPSVAQIRHHRSPLAQTLRTKRGRHTPPARPIGPTLAHQVWCTYTTTVAHQPTTHVPIVAHTRHDWAEQLFSTPRERDLLSSITVLRAKRVRIMRLNRSFLMQGVRPPWLHSPFFVPSEYGPATTPFCAHHSDHSIATTLISWREINHHSPWTYKYKPQSNRGNKNKNTTHYTSIQFCLSFH